MWAYIFKIVRFLHEKLTRILALNFQALIFKIYFVKLNYLYLNFISKFVPIYFNINNFMYHQQTIM